MKIIESIEEMREYSQQLKNDGKTIGLIDTEGCLHDGHMFLVKIAKENVDVVILGICHTIYYFEHSTEKYEVHLKLYQQDFIEKEIKICELNNVDVLFLPSMDDLYTNSSTISLDSLPLNVQNFLQTLPINIKFILGAKELYNITLPDIIVLGQKDVYQTFILKSLIKQLNLSIKVIMIPTIRDSDGLAFSSRNQLLTFSERCNATSIYQTLHEISRWSVYPPVVEIKEHITKRINQANGHVSHLDICCAETLEELDSIDRKFVIIVDVFFGKIMLGDNIIIEP
jgi:pantoate--beta-alanine ligase